MNTPATTPPAAQTHRKPITITAQQIFAHRARLAARTTPNTHRGEPRPVLEELAIVNARFATNKKEPGLG